VHETTTALYAAAVVDPLLQWLTKQAAARKEVDRAKAAQPGDVEHDPLWYRDRAR